MSRNVELLDKFAQESGLYIYMQRSRLSEAEYVEVTTEDDDRRAKIRIANHETRPTYGRAYGYADFEIPKNGVSRGDVHGDVYHCIRWLADRFEKPVPAWASEAQVASRSARSQQAAGTRWTMQKQVEAVLIRDLLEADRSKRLTQAQVSAFTRKYLPKAALSRITQAFNERRKATHVSLRHDPHTFDDRPSGWPRKHWQEDVVEKPWLVEVNGKGLSKWVSETNSWRRVSLPEAFAAAQAMADHFAVPVRPEDPDLLKDPELRDGEDPDLLKDPELRDGPPKKASFAVSEEDQLSDKAGEDKPDQVRDLLPTLEASSDEQAKPVLDLREPGNIEMAEAAKLAFSVSETDEKPLTRDDEVRKRLWRTAKYAKDGGVYNGKPVWAGVADERGAILAVVSHEEAARHDFLPEKYLSPDAYEAARVPEPGIFFHYNLSGHLDLTSHKPVTQDARIALEQSLDVSMALNHWPQDQGHLSFAVAQPGTGWRKVAVEADRFEDVTPDGPVPAYQKGSILLHKPIVAQTGNPIGYEGTGITRVDLEPFLEDGDPGIAEMAAMADRRLSLNASFKAVAHAVFQAAEPDGVKNMSALIAKLGGQVKRDGDAARAHGAGKAGVGGKAGGRGWVASRIDDNTGSVVPTFVSYARLKDAKHFIDTLKDEVPKDNVPFGQTGDQDAPGTAPDTAPDTAPGTATRHISSNTPFAAMPYRVVPVNNRMFSSSEDGFELRARHWRSGMLGRDIGRDASGNPVWGGVVDLHGTVLTTVSKEKAAGSDFDPCGLVDAGVSDRLQDGSALFFRFEDSGDLSLFSTKPADLVPGRIAAAIRESLDPVAKLESFERLLAILHDKVSIELAQMRDQGMDTPFLSRNYGSPASQTLAFAIDKDAEAGESTRSPVVPPRKRKGDIWFEDNRECYLVDKGLVVARRTDPAAVRRRREIAEDRAFEELARKLMPNAVIEIVDGVFPTTDGAGVETCSGATLPPENDAAPKRIRVYLLATDTERLYKTLIHEAFHYHQLAGTLPREEYQHVIERSVEEAWAERLLPEDTTLEAVTGGWCRTRPVVPPSAILPGTAAWVYGSEGAAETFAQHHFKALVPDYQSGFDLPVLSEQAEALFEGIASGKFGAGRDSFFAANEPAVRLVRYSDGYVQSNDTVKKFSFAIDQSAPEAAPETNSEAVAEGPAVESAPEDNSAQDERPWPGNDPAGPDLDAGSPDDPMGDAGSPDDPMGQSNALMDFMITKMGLNPAVAVAMDKVFLGRAFTQEQEDWIAAPLIVHSQAPGGLPLKSLIPEWLSAQVRKERLDIVREEIKTGTRNNHLGPSEIAAIMMPATQSFPLDHAAADLYVWATLHAVALRDDVSPEEAARRTGMDLPDTSKMLRGHTMDGTAGGLYLSLSQQARLRAVETYSSDRRQQEKENHRKPQPGKEGPGKVTEQEEGAVCDYLFSFAVDPGKSLAESEPLEAPFEARVRSKALEILEANEEIGAARASDLTEDKLTVVALAELRDLKANYEEGMPPQAGSIRIALGEKAL